MRLFGIGIALLVGFASWPVLAECVAVKYREAPICPDVPKRQKAALSVRSAMTTPKSYMLIKLNDTWYHYCAVDPASVDSLLNALSIGTYYNEHFRSHVMHGPFDCRDHPVPNYP